MSNKPEIKFIKRNRKKENKKMELEELSNKMKKKKREKRSAGFIFFVTMAILFLFLFLDWQASSSPNAKYESHGYVNKSRVTVISIPIENSKINFSNAEIEKFVIPALLLIWPISFQTFLDYLKEFSELKETVEKIKQS